MNLDILAEPWLPSFMALFIGLILLLFGIIEKAVCKNYKSGNFLCIFGAISIIISFFI